MDKLEEARAAIDRADRELAPLFEARMRAAAAVAEYKWEHGLPVYDAARERAVLEAGLSRIADEALRPYYGEFLQEMMAVSRRYQCRLLGLAGQTPDARRPTEGPPPLAGDSRESL